MKIKKFKDTTAEEISNVDKGANRRFYAYTKAEGSNMKVMEAVLSTEAEKEEQLKELGLSEKAGDAATAIFRIAKAYSEDLTAEQVAGIVKAAGHDVSVTPAPVVVEPVVELTEVQKAAEKKHADEVAVLKADRDAANEELEVLKAAETKEKFVTVAKSYDKVGEAEELGTLIQKASGLGEGFAEQLKGVLAIAQTRIEEGELFSTKGANPTGDGDGDARVRLNKAADLILEEGKAKTSSAAYGMAMSQNPDLVKEMRETRSN